MFDDQPNYPVSSGESGVWLEMTTLSPSVGIKLRSEWRDIVVQATTYACPIFYSNPTQTFALVIGISHKSRTARFLFFHRGGLASMPELTMDGENPMFPNSSGASQRWNERYRT